jgi:Polysaccharide deacetylase
MTKATLLFFWDYDTQWGADRSRSPGGPKSWGPLEFVHTERLLELHREYQVPACFAVVGAAALPGERPYHDPEQIRRIHNAGHEVASHSFHHDWLPALEDKALTETLHRSKEALESCIGAKVVTFVPPFNQPFDCVQRFSLSVSERLAVRRQRTDLAKLCSTLAKVGYHFCRVAYRPMHERLIDRLQGEVWHRPARAEHLGGVICVRLNTEGGFAASTHELLERCVQRGGIAVVYGHPHSLSADNTQNERLLVPFLKHVAGLSRAGRLQIKHPRDLLGA